ncbi:class I SAM-dependent methyltransferase [Shewanella frigidimarina]|uniref:class I SAM-dependent methyltransferase n=1 Tax=Shewanella frigidimarina TaxID=56812 RepID=UPI003D7B925F
MNKIEETSNKLQPHQNSSLTELHTVICVVPNDKKDENHLIGLSASEFTIVTSSLTVLASILVAYSTIRKYSKDHKHQLNLLEREKEKEAILKAKEKIEKFYGPLNAHLEESRIIYEHFATEEKKILKQQGDYFRTLRYLTNGPDNQVKGINRFKPHDQELLSHILKISDQVIKLIEKNSGYVDNSELHTLLGKLAAHYRIIKSASEGKLTNQADYLESIVFPLEINGAINSEICKLTNIINSIKQISVPTNKTIDFYDENHLDYYLQTSESADMEFTYDLVRKFVVNGSCILDAGCGVGRDTKFFIQHGFKVVSFDASKKMVDMCNEYPFAFCEHKCFEIIKYPPVFDLVWACASLLHLDKAAFKDALTKLHRSLKPGGVLYFSLKSKVDKSKSKGREFFKYEFNDVSTILKSELNMTHLNSWSSISAISNSERFENYIFRK